MSRLDGDAALVLGLAAGLALLGGALGALVMHNVGDQPPEPAARTVIGGFPKCGADIPDVYERYRQDYLRAADPQLHGPTACQLARQGWFESQWKPDAVSPAGAIGIAQFEPATARDYGIDPRRPDEAITAQARYMAHLMGVWHHHHRTPEDIFALALASYNWGIGNLLRSQRRHGWIAWAEARPHVPQETQDYVRRITRG